MPIDSISDTARWVAALRAEESERADAAFHDPWARALAGPEGFALTHELGARRTLSWSLVARTVALDRCVARAAAAGFDAVVNLACGLDSRPYRLELPAGLQWWEADLPALLAHKEKVLGAAPARCRLERRAVDLSDGAAREALFDQLDAAGVRRALVITEGLLVYLPDEAVAGLAQSLAHRPWAQRWAMDLYAPELLPFVQGLWNRRLAEGGARLQFAPRLGSGWFGRFGFKQGESWPLVQTGAEVKRGFEPWLWGQFGGLLGPFRGRVGDLARIVELERD